jgi:glycosyltransferase involved in cell wall biosynthesis
VAQASVIVRCRNEAPALKRALASLRSQTMSPEIIVVDSGSDDGSLEVADAYCDELIEIAPADFSYGRALNIGARAASAPVHFAFSAHCYAERSDWIERSLSHYTRPNVAGTNGVRTLADDTPVNRPFAQDAEYLRKHPWWGFSNHASSWRAEIWERFPFNEDLDYAEDREWGKRVLEAGYVIVYDPALWVDPSHAWRAGVRTTYVRQRRAWAAMASFTEMPAYGFREVIRDWWHWIPNDRHSALFHRFINYRRLAALLGQVAGAREAARRSKGDVAT